MSWAAGYEGSDLATMEFAAAQGLSKQASTTELTKGIPSFFVGKAFHLSSKVVNLIRPEVTTNYFGLLMTVFCLLRSVTPAS